MLRTQKTVAEGIELIFSPPLGWLVVDRPKRKNAINRAMWKAIPHAVDQLCSDQNVRVIVLRGGGEETFIAGADISEFDEVRKDKKTSRSYERLNDLAFDALRNADKPTVAMIRGHCLGGGMALAMACDLRIADGESRFGIPAAKLGVGYPPKSIADIVALVGPSVAKDIFFTARQFDGTEARHLGLINRLVEPGKLEFQTIALAREIATLAPLTQRAAKSAINALVASDFGPAQSDVQTLCDQCFDSHDFIEGRTAFKEKRRPVFKGS
ncbi:MAG: enoyl-CoA hydratase [Stappiaceae bacterium]